MNATDLYLRANSELEQRTLLTLMAYAAGDAFGVAYEFLPEKVSVDVTVISPRKDWPLGGVSDDTLLSLLTIFAVHPDNPVLSGETFISALHVAAPSLRGLGPTTRAALGLELTAEDMALVGHTNGGMMRTSLLGLAYSPDHALERRQMVAALARATHVDPSAIACAVLCSALYSAALAGTQESVVATVRAEARQLDFLPDDVRAMLLEIENWSAPDTGISLNPVETLAAVLWVASRASDCADAYRLSCEMGGDTDTVAALAGGLIAARTFTASDLLAIGWIDEVVWSEIDEVSAAATALSRMRDAS